MGRIFFTLISIFLLASACTPTLPQAASSTPAVLSAQQGLYDRQLLVGSQKLNVQVASSLSELQQGLSGRAAMADDQGMLFDLSALADKQTPFWMIDMKFGLDFLWIKNGQVVQITKNVPKPMAGTPSSQLPTYSPAEPVSWVLEVNAGWSDEHGVKVGDSVNLIPN